MSETPRTDAKQQELYAKYLKEITVNDMPKSKADDLQYKELLDSHKQLERELDEAKKEIQLLTQGFETSQGTKLRESRDEWKACAEALACVNNPFPYCECDTCKALTTFNQLKEKLK